MIRKIILLVIFLPSILCSRIFLVPEEFRSLQSALIQAKNGDTISVKPPVYGTNFYRNYTSDIADIRKDVIIMERGVDFQRGKVLFSQEETGYIPVINPPLKEVRMPCGQWQGPQPVNEPGSHFTVGPHIAFHPDGNPWAVWYGATIYYSRWNGLSWEPEGEITPVDTLFDSRPTIAIDEDGTVFVVWSHEYHEGYDPPGNDIHYSNWYDSLWYGSGWTFPRAVSQTIRFDYAPVISSGGGETWVTWYGDTFGINPVVYEVYASHWNGSGWDPEVLVSHSDWGDEWYTYVAVDKNGRPHFVWSEYYTGTIWYRTYDGNSWSDIIAIVDTTSEVRGFDPAIAVDDEGNLHVVFTGHVLQNPTDLDIYYTKSTDGGLTWTYPVMVNEDDEFYDEAPRVAVSIDNSVWCIWSKSISFWDGHCYARNLTDSFSCSWQLDGDETYIDGAISIACDTQGYPWVMIDAIWRDTLTEPFTIFFNRYSYYSFLREEKKKIATYPSGKFRANLSLDGFKIEEVGVPTYVEIYSASGRKIAHWDLTQIVRKNQFVWDGRDIYGNYLSNGVYILKVSIGNRKHSQKILLLR